MILNLNRLKELLYADSIIRNKIQRDYGFGNVTSIDDFSSLLISSLNQSVKNIRRKVSNEEVFEAAVKSLGSNSRNWITFISKEESLKSILFNYDPIKVNQHREELMTELRPFFPGQSCSNDVTAVLRWAEKLSTQENYYSTYIKQVMEAFEKLHESKYHSKIDDSVLFICVAGFFASPPSKWEGEQYLLNIDLTKDKDLLKFNGMLYPLASEFLRNLGWNGFKPDRHIMRLFDFWLGSEELVTEKEINYILDLNRSSKKELKEFIKYSLIGQKISPKDLSYSEVDNFIWAVGAYVIKKGKEEQYKSASFFINDIEMLDGITAINPDAISSQHETRGGKTDKIITSLLFEGVRIEITEYDGYVCDVILKKPESNELIYKSPKMSLKDALTFLGYEGEELKQARKTIMQMKKQAKKELVTT